MEWHTAGAKVLAQAMKDPSNASDNRTKLPRFHSLLFGTDAASAKEDGETSLGLTMRLAGFLNSESKTPEDQAYIRKLLSQVHFNILSSCRASRSDREALEQANCPAGFRISESQPTDFDRIKRLKCLNSVIGAPRSLPKGSDPDSARGPTVHSNPPSTSSEVDTLTGESDVGNIKERSLAVFGQSLCQSKLTNHYGGLSTKPCERFKAPATGQSGSGSQGPISKASTSRSLPNADFCSSPGTEDVEINRKRGPFSDFNQPAEKKQRPELKEGDSDYDTRKRLQTKTRPAIRVDDDDDDRGRIRQDFYSNRNQGKMKPQQEDDSEDDMQEIPASFITARKQLALQEAKKNKGSSCPAVGCKPGDYGKKTLGLHPRGPRSAFVPPVQGNKVNGGISRFEYNSENCWVESTRLCLESLAGPDGELPTRLRNIEPKLLEHITNEIMERDPMVRWDDIAGLEHAKKCVTEMVIWPLLRPDIFQGCRAPAKGLLLFGPPGTGKTMIGKAIAGEARATFFSISASSIMSKWMGEAEKLVRALFGVAACRQPSVIFIDEVDSLLSQRKSDGENDSSRKIKTQFLIEMEGCGTGTEQVLVIGATNRPQELDEAARRRLSKRLYIPLPSAAARSWIVRNLLGKDGLLSLSDEEVDAICTCTDGYSGSDMKNLVKEASMGPLREALMYGKHINDITNDDMRQISLQDFMTSLQQVRSSVSKNELGLYEDWNKQYGSLAV